MEALRKRIAVDKEGFIKVPVPPSFGRQVEIIVLPASYEEEHDESEYFECVAEDGTGYRLNDWTDAEFNEASMMSAWKADDTTAEEIFDVDIGALAFGKHEYSDKSSWKVRPGLITGEYLND